MPLATLQIKPGFYTDVTEREVARVGYWQDGDKVRFKRGLPEKLKGWETRTSDAYAGAARTVIDWKDIEEAQYIAFGTNTKLYIYDGSSTYDITPFRSELTSQSITQATTDGSAVVTVTHTAHGAVTGDTVYFSNASGAIGGITLDGEYVLIKEDDNTYTVTHGSNASATTSGAVTIDIDYEINVGNAISFVGDGWGAGAWGAPGSGAPGSDGWDTARAGSAFLIHSQIWSLDTWGEDLIAANRDGTIYVWDTSGSVSNRATIISNAPSRVKGAFVSSENRQVVALGAHDGTSYDPLLVRWSDAEDYDTWTAALRNQAGSKRLDAGNEIICAVKARNEYLIFTDSHIFSMTYVGAPYVFDVRLIGENGGVCGPNAVKVYNSVVYWMSSSGFYYYDGAIKELPCTVFTYVFDNLTRTNMFEVYCARNREENELWWLYPHGSAYLNAYVIFNLSEQAWYYGTLDRTSLVMDSDVISYNYGFETNGMTIFEHETGVDDDGSAMTAYITTGDVEIDDGNLLPHVDKFIPDFKTLTGSVDFTATGKKYPESSETQTVSAITISPTTEHINPRIRCRQISFTITSDAVGDNWRMGMPRLNFRGHGRR